MGAKAQLHYGEQIREIELPTGWELVANPAARPTPEIDGAALLAALRNPVGTPPLAELARGRRDAVVLMPDLTRPLKGEVGLGLLLDEMNRGGIPDERIAVMFARGTHLTPPEVRERFRSRHGPPIDRVEFLVHDPDEDLVYLGDTSRGHPIWMNRRAAAAELKVGFSEIMPHVVAGYSGGAKIVLPGVAGRETIIQNHLLVADPMADCGIVDGNPVRDEMEEVARRFGTDFIFNLVLEGPGRVIGAAAGDVVAAHRRGVEIARSAFEVEVDRPADVLITSGYPLDIHLYQSFKGFSMAAGACKPGADVIHCSPAHEGVRSSTVGLYHEALGKGNHRRTVDKMNGGDRESADVRPYFWPEVNIGVASTMFRTISNLGLQVHVVSDGVSAEDVARMGLKPASSLEAAIAAVAAKRPRADVIVARSAEVIVRARAGA